MRQLRGAIGAMVLGLAVASPAAAQEGTEQQQDGAVACPGHAQMQGQMAQNGQAADGCPAGCPMHAEGGACPGHAAGGGGCPMMKAAQAGASVQVEETAQGATIRITAPQGDQQAVQQARESARQVAQMMEQGCPGAQGMQQRQNAPGMQQRQGAEQRQNAPGMQQRQGAQGSQQRQGG